MELTRSNVRLENFRNAFINLIFEIASRQPVAFDWLVKDAGVRGLAKQYVEIHRHINLHYEELYKRVEDEYKATHPQEEAAAAPATAPENVVDDVVSADVKETEDNKENVGPVSGADGAEIAGID